MPGKNLDDFANLAQYTEAKFSSMPVPEDDAAPSVRGAERASITSSHNPHADVDVMSIATKSRDLPNNNFGPLGEGNLKKDGWMDRPSIDEETGPRARSTTAKAK